MTKPSQGDIQAAEQAFRAKHNRPPITNDEVEVAECYRLAQAHAVIALSKAAERVGKDGDGPTVHVCVLPGAWPGRREWFSAPSQTSLDTAQSTGSKGAQ